MTGGRVRAGRRGLALRATRAPARPPDVPARRIRIGAWVALVAGLGVAVTGDVQGKIMTEVAADEDGGGRGAVRDRDSRASFSIFTIGTPDGSRRSSRSRSRTCCRSSPPARFDGEVEGINDLRAQYEQTYGQDPGAAYYTAGDYVPNIPVTYWTLPLHDRRRHARRRRRAAADPLADPQGTRADRPVVRRGWRSPSRCWLLLGNSFGWIFTEMGRQPWVGLRPDDHRERRLARRQHVRGARPPSSCSRVLYAVLAVIELGLLLRGTSARAPNRSSSRRTRHPRPDEDDDQPLAFAY